MVPRSSCRFAARRVSVLDLDSSHHGDAAHHKNLVGVGLVLKGAIGEATEDRGHLGLHGPGARHTDVDAAPEGEDVEQGGLRADVGPRSGRW